MKKHLKTFIFVLISLLINIIIAQAEKMIYQEYNVIEELYDKKIPSIYKVFISIYNTKTDIIQDNNIIYSYIIDFQNYPEITHISIDHQTKKYYTEKYNAQQDMDNPLLKDIFKNVKIKENQQQTYINNKNINSIKYILTLQNQTLMEIILSKVQDILSSGEFEEYKKLKSKTKNFLDPLANLGNIDFFKQIKAKLDEDFIITGLYSNMVFLKQTMTKFAIIDQNPTIFNIPKEYQKE